MNAPVLPSRPSQQQMGPPVIPVREHKPLPVVPGGTSPPVVPARVQPGAPTPKPTPPTPPTPTSSTPTPRSPPSIPQRSAPTLQTPAPTDNFTSPRPLVPPRARPPVPDQTPSVHLNLHHIPESDILTDTDPRKSHRNLPVPTNFNPADIDSSTSTVENSPAPVRELSKTPSVPRNPAVPPRTPLRKAVSTANEKPTVRPKNDPLSLDVGQTAQKATSPNLMRSQPLSSRNDYSSSLTPPLPQHQPLTSRSNETKFSGTLKEEKAKTDQAFLATTLGYQKINPTGELKMKIVGVTFSTEHTGMLCKKYANYKIEVEQEGEHWTIFRRFSAFYTLDEKLKANGLLDKSDKQLPSKTGLKRNNEETAIEARKAELQAYFDNVLSQPAIRASHYVFNVVRPFQIGDIKPKK